MLIDRQGAPLGSPGCFGRALSFRAGTPECDTCPFAGACAPISLARTEAVRAKMGVKLKEPRRAAPAKPKPVALPPQVVAMDWPKKVIELIQRWERMGIRVTETLARGENPFTSTPAFMRVACHVLLSKPQGVNRRFLSVCLMHKLGWAENVATPQATQAIQALCAIGAAVEKDGVVTLRR